jgi:hypothetical protein
LLIGAYTPELMTGFLWLYLQKFVKKRYHLRTTTWNPLSLVAKGIALLEQLPGESLARAVKFLEALSHEALQESKTTPSASETALLEIIQRRLPPEDEKRLAYLRQFMFSAR